MSACMAIRLSTVSSMVSPLACDEVLTLRLMTSADRRLAAISKVVRVRVLLSKKILHTVLPRSNGTFFTSRSATPTKDSAVSSIWRRISACSPSILNRCLSLPFLLSWGLALILISCGLVQFEQEFSAIVARQLQVLSCGERQFCPDHLRLHRQFASAAIHQHCQRDFRRAAVVEQFIHRGANGAAGIEHIVHQDDMAALHVKRDAGWVVLRVQADA